jgi:hypothetical protein
MARALLVERADHFVERAKASAVVKDVEAKIAAQAARKLERKSKHSSNPQSPALQALPMNETYAQNGAAK